MMIKKAYRVMASVSPTPRPNVIYIHRRLSSGCVPLYDNLSCMKLINLSFNTSADVFMTIFKRTSTEEQNKEGLVEIKEKGGQISGQISGQIITEKQERVLELIEQNPHITRYELSDKLQINPSAIQKHINNLKKSGKIKRVGSDKGGYWEIV